MPHFFFILLFTGLTGFTKSLAKEVASRNVRVNMVAPGFIETDMTSNLRKQNSRIESLIPLGRYGKAHEVAETVCFLAETIYITGQVQYMLTVHVIMGTLRPQFLHLSMSRLRVGTPGRYGAFELDWKLSLNFLRDSEWSEQNM